LRSSGCGRKPLAMTQPWLTLTLGEGPCMGCGLGE
jgi:hypothetical protein